MSQVPSPHLTALADGSGSTDTDRTPIASYHFDFGDGSPIVSTLAPIASATHTYAAAGHYTVTLNEQVAVRPTLSVSIAVTDRDPACNTLPEAGITLALLPQLSVVVAV